jgi:hypothetical protein
VLEKLLNNGINHHVFSQGFMNKNKYGFTPQKGTIDATMTVKAFVKEGLAAGEVIVLVSLDVRGAFDAAWWSGILKELRACGCPKNLYELTELLFPAHNDFVNQQLSIGERNKHRMPAGVLVRPRLLEYTIQFIAELEIYDTNKSGGLCG